MYKYVIGLRCGGLMEDPEWHIEDVKEIIANNLKEAKDKWVTITESDESADWNTKPQTVWGWRVLVLTTNDPNVPDDEFYKYAKNRNKKATYDLIERIGIKYGYIKTR